MHLARWLVVAAVALASSAAADGNAGVLAPNDNAIPNADTGRITVNAMSAPIPVNALADDTTSSPTTTQPQTKTPSPSTRKPSTTTTAPSSSTTPPTGSGSGTLSPSSSTPAPNGSGVKCAFRYSLPMASNLAAELQKSGSTSSSSGSGAGGRTPSGSSRAPSSGSLSGSNNGGRIPDVGTGSTTGSPDTRQPSAGSGSGNPNNNAGGGNSRSPSPSPSSSSPAPTSTTKRPLTSPSPSSSTSRTPTTTSPSSTPTKTPSSGGSGDGTSTTRLLQETPAGETTSPSTTTSRSPRPSSSTSTRTPSPTPPTGTGSNAGEVGPSRTPTSSPSATSAGSQGTASPTPSSSSTATPTPGATATNGTQPQTEVVTGEFTCDAQFYGAWATLGLQCGGRDLDVAAAVGQSKCVIYSGVQATDLRLCLSVCKFPKCANGTWDYAAEDGLSSEVYAGLNFVNLLSTVSVSNNAGAVTNAAAREVLGNLTVRNERECAYESEASFKTCQCENFQGSSDKKANKDKGTGAPGAALRPVVDKGMGDGNHWGDGEVKKPIDKVGIASAAIGGGAAALSVTIGGAMSVAGGVMSTTGGVATGISAGASLGVAMAAVDLCQFGVMINQMNLDATPRVLQDMGRRMSASTFQFLPFGKIEPEQHRRRLAELAAGKNDTQGMERYATIIGVKVDMLFYLTLAGVMGLSVLPFVLCALLCVLAAPFVSDRGAFARKWFDKTVGVLMMVLILSEYVVGVTATFQICWSIKKNTFDAGFYLAIFALLFFAVGTILYGYYVINRHEDELRDLGTKDHMDKAVYARYGPLYDEYKYESRYFFAPKLMLALFSGMTTGVIWIQGIWQAIILIGLHIAFLVYLEVKQPYPTAFVQKTSSFVIIIKISALFLTLFLISSATNLQKDIPVDLRQGVGFAIIGLQVLVLIALMVRQVYIFYLTWKLKREDSEKQEQERQRGNESFYPLGDNMHGGHNGQNQGNVPILGGGHGNSTPLQNDFYLQTPDRFKGSQQFDAPKLRGLQQQPSRRTQTVVVHENATPAQAYRSHREVDL